MTEMSGIDGVGEVAWSDQARCYEVKEGKRWHAQVDLSASVAMPGGKRQIN